MALIDMHCAHEQTSRLSEQYKESLSEMTMLEMLLRRMQRKGRRDFGVLEGKIGRVARYNLTWAGYSLAVLVQIDQTQHCCVFIATADAAKMCLSAMTQGRYARESGVKAEP